MGGGCTAMGEQAAAGAGRGGRTARGGRAAVGAVRGRAGRHAGARGPGRGQAAPGMCCCILHFAECFKAHHVQFNKGAALLKASRNKHAQLDEEPFVG